MEETQLGIVCRGLECDGGVEEGASMWKENRSTLEYILSNASRTAAEDFRELSLTR